MTLENQATSPAPGWYDDGSGRQRWWDGSQWTNHFAPVAQPMVFQPQPRMANGMQVSYTRPQTGHSLTKWVIASLFLVFPVIGLVYYSVSPNHYWHA